ncbi:hypothetical protein LguiB_027150 [Lonicera macranthoides]
MAQYRASGVSYTTAGGYFKGNDSNYWHILSLVAPTLLSKSCKFFIHELTHIEWLNIEHQESHALSEWLNIEHQEHRTLQHEDILRTIQQYHVLPFDMLPPLEEIECTFHNI